MYSVYATGVSACMCSVLVLQTIQESVNVCTVLFCSTKYAVESVCMYDVFGPTEYVGESVCIHTVCSLVYVQ